MNQTLKEVLNILLNPAVTFFIGILTVVMTRNSNRSTVARERLELAYHPLFMEIEPFLYKKVSYNDIAPFLAKYYEIESKYSLLIYPSLRNMVHSLDEKDGAYTADKYGYNKWFYICDYISKDYDSLCRQSHLPLRSVAYRVNNKQYKNKTTFIFAILWLNLPIIVVFSFMLGVIMPELLLITYALFFIFLILQTTNCL